MSLSYQRGGYIQHISFNLKQWILSWLGTNFEQFENRPVWYNSDVVVKLYPNKEYLTNVITAHNILDHNGYSSQLFEIYDSNGEYGVVEEYINGINLSTIDEDDAMKLIEEYYDIMRNTYHASDWDFNPANYVINSDGKLIMIDLGDVFFG